MHISENDRLRMLRPSINAFDKFNLPAEYFRWFDTEGVARKRPLDEDELVKFLVAKRGIAIKDARAEVREKTQAGKLDKQIWLAVQNPMVDRMIEAMCAEITKYGLGVLQRYPSDVLIHDRNMLLFYAVNGAEIAWTISECASHMAPLGLLKSKNEEVGYFMNDSSSQRFYKIKVGLGDFKITELSREAFANLEKTRVPYEKVGTNESFSLMKGDSRIGVVTYKDVGNYCNRKFEVDITPVAGISSLDRSALDLWASQGAINLAHTLFVRSITTWHDKREEVLAA